MTSWQTADESRDVVIHYVQEIDARSDERRERWMVFLGEEQRGEVDTLDDALALAKRLAVRSNRPAWLLDSDGYPLKPVDLEGIQG
jgi:hypothetical protein